MKEDYAKLKSAIRYWMLGRGYHTALAAMELGLQHHVGTRKDGVTPEFQHQVEQANFARTLIDSLDDGESVLATIFLHDVVEDPGPDGRKIPIARINDEFGTSVGNSVWLLTNQYPNGEKKPKRDYYDGIATDAIASIVKGCDRFHNQSSMVGVFTHAKQKQYIEETETLVLPMLKTARKKFTRQEPAYQNIKWALKQQIALVKAVHEAAKKD